MLLTMNCPECAEVLQHFRCQIKCKQLALAFKCQNDVESWRCSARFPTWCLLNPLPLGCPCKVFGRAPNKDPSPFRRVLPSSASISCASITPLPLLSLSLPTHFRAQPHNTALLEPHHHVTPPRRKFFPHLSLTDSLSGQGLIL